IDYCYSLKFCLSKFETTSQNKNHSVRKWLLFSINLFIHERDARASWSIGTTNYNRVENGQREASVEVLDKLANYYGITIDEIVHFEDKKLPPKEITIQDKAIVEQVNLISQLDEKEKNVVYTIVESFLSKKRFKDFVQQNVAL
ncbi:MAG TPA: helix-turn-helix transcriptional regulator, partial [Flavobacterium sp.]